MSKSKAKTESPKTTTIETPTKLPTPAPLTPDDVWAEVTAVSQRLGIDTKMAIDLLQLTNQRKNAKLTETVLAECVEKITALCGPAATH